MKTSTLLTSSLVAALAAYYWGESVYRTMTVSGVFRWQVPNMYADDDIVYIEDTQHCEDVHYHDGLLYTACEDNLDLRFKWFPGLGHFDEPEVAAKSKGSIHVVDPKTMKSRRLEFQNFDHVLGFITHGFDIIPDPDQPSGKVVYIIAINHLPNPKWTATSSRETHKAKSRLEVFRHEIGSSTIKHIRSVWSPLIRTPNDIFALSPTTIFVSNDHYHREGIKRMLEDINVNAKYTDVVKIELDPKTLTSSSFTAEEEGVTASLAIPSIHNSNGMGHGRTDREILIASCASGIFNIGQIDDNGNITLTDAIPAEIVIDNLSYFPDPYSKESPKGGFLLPGIARPVTLGHSARDPSYEGEPKDPVMVLYATPRKTAEKKWEQRLVFSDDGSRLRSISGSVMVAIDPATQEDKTKRQAWLFMTGFISRNMIAVKVDL